MSKKAKSNYVTCPDCGAKYLAGKPHMMFCAAHTCDECGTSYSFVIELNSEDRRVCDKCLGWEE